MVDKRISELDPAGPLTGNELVELVQDVGGQLDSVQSPLQDIVQQLALQGPQGQAGPSGAQGPSGASGADGSDGWSPLLAIVNDGTRRVLQLSGWTGGAGASPASGKYIGAAGLVDAIADAIDLRGSQGPQGAQGQPGVQGPQGNPGTAGSSGDDGWSPVFAIVDDGARRVLQITGWTGGTGPSPASGKYGGATGLVDAIADAVDLRGPQGLQGLQGSSGDPGPAGGPGAAGHDGYDGWSPAFAVIADGARRVLEISGWTGGSGSSPTSGEFVGPTGMVDDIGDAADIRGAQGAQGDAGPPGTQGPQGTQGNPGTAGADGDDGWSPQLALVSDGARRVLKVSGWTGGSGTPPTSDLYIGLSGLVSDIANAVDVRGAAGVAGTNGTNGSTWRSGSGAPSAALGVDGDFYFRTDTDDVYQKAIGVYSVIANIKGSPGPSGSAGTAGADGATWRDGSGAPSNGLGNNGDYYLNVSQGDVYRKSAGNYSMVVNIMGPPGAAGSGVSSGFNYSFNSATTGDPGSGKFALDNATFGNLTQLSISKTDADSNGLTALLATLYAGRRASVFVRSSSGAFLELFVNGPATDNGSYDTFPITPAAAAGTIANSDACNVSFVPGGDSAPFYNAATTDPVMGIPGVNSFTQMGTNTFTGQRIFYSPFLLRQRTKFIGVNAITGGTVSTSPTFYWGIYKWDRANAMPTELLASVSQAVVANTHYARDFATPVSLAPGLYAAAFLCDKTGTQSCFYGDHTMEADAFVHVSGGAFKRPRLFASAAGKTSLPNPETAAPTGFDSAVLGAEAYALQTTFFNFFRYQAP